MRSPTFGGMKFFVTLIDDKSQHCAVYLMRNKSEVFSKFAHFVNMAENKTDSRIKVLRSDNGGEYKSAKFVRFCADRGIIQKFTPPYTPELNGVAERMNRTLVECARCMLEHASLAKEYWGEAVMTAAFLRNRLPTRAHTSLKTPYEEWTKKTPILANVKVFGCHVYVHVPKEKRLKLDPRATLCRFLGYSEHEKAYRFEDLSSGRIIISRDAKFMEDTFTSGKYGQALDSVTEFQDGNDVTDNQDDDEDMPDQSSENMESCEETQLPQEQEYERPNAKFVPGSNRYLRTQSLESLSRPPSSKRHGRVSFTNGTPPRPSQRPEGSLKDMSALLTSIKEEELNCAYVVDSVEEVPTSFKSAMEFSDASKWKEACESEFESLIKNKT